MARIQTLAGEWFEPELPGRLLKIAGDIREAGGRAFWSVAGCVTRF